MENQIQLQLQLHHFCIINYNYNYVIGPGSARSEGKDICYYSLVCFSSSIHTS